MYPGGVPGICEVWTLQVEGRFGGQGDPGLAESIEALRSELSAAVDSGASQSMRFVVEPVESTVQAAVSNDASNETGWSVLGLGPRWARPPSGP